MNNYLIAAAACAVMSGIGMCLVGTLPAVVVGLGSMYAGGALALMALTHSFDR